MKEQEIHIWKPIEYDDKWNHTDTSKLDDLVPSWHGKRETIKADDDEYHEFMNRLKRQHAIETGVVEKLYDLTL